MKTNPIPFTSSAKWAGFIDLDGTFYLDMMKDSVAAAQMPYPQCIDRLEAIESRITTKEPLKGLMASIVYPVGMNYCTKCIQLASSAALTRAACSIFLYKSKHHAYPSTLADADPTAVDTFDGKLLGYRREPHGFVVYSVGPTLKYDGGAFNNKKQYEELFRYKDK